MKRKFKFDRITEKYLITYYSILDKMISGMTSAKLTDSISHNFIVQMIPHHKAAIEMSENILKYTKNAQLKNIAEQIITEQTKSIENMQNIKHKCSKLTNSKEELWQYQGKMDEIIQTMFARMKCARSTNQVDCDFMWEMIPHHMGAVEMATTTLRHNICPQLVPILNAIIKSQRKGIRQMEKLLQTLGC